MPETTKFKWTIPTVGAHKNAWGGILNTLFSDIDTDVQRLTAIATTAPAAPGTGDLWVDTSGSPVLKVWSGSAWNPLTGAGATQLSELSDVGAATPAAGNVLLGDGVDFDSKSLADAGIAPASHSHVEADITDLDHDADKIKGKAVDDSGLADNRVLKYDAVSETWKVEDESPGGVTDHGALTGLDDDDHPHYHTDARGDSRYHQQSKFINMSAGTGDAGKPIKLDADGNIDATMINDSDVDHNAITNSHNLTTDIDHGAITNSHNLTTDIDHDAITNSHNLTTDIDHNQLTNYRADEHRQINDAGTGVTDLWSADKINTELGGKAPISHTHIEADITDLDHDAVKIQGKSVDLTGLSDDDVLVYDQASDSFKPGAQSVGGTLTTVSNTALADGQKLICTHASSPQRSRRDVGAVRYVAGAETDEITPFTNEADYDQGDVKGTIAYCEVDTANTSGHFEDSGNNPVAVGSGQTEDRILAGCRFYCNDTWYEITSITGDGTSSDEVTFTAQDGSIPTIAQGTYAVSYIHGTEFDSGKVTLNSSLDGSGDTLPGDYINEDCADITDWTANDGGTGVSSQETFDGKSCFKFDTGASASTAEKAERWKQPGVLPTEFSFEINLFHSALGAVSDGDDFRIAVWNGAARHRIKFGTDELVHDLGSGWGNIVKTGKWQTWRFVVTGSTAVDCYELVNGVWIHRGQSITTDTTTINDGRVTIGNRGETTANMITYVDYFTLENSVETPVNATVYPASGRYATTTNGLSQIDCSGWTDIGANGFTIVETTSATTENLFAVSWDGRVTWRMYDPTPGDEGFRLIARNNAGTWQFNANTTSGYSTVTWTDAVTSGENTQESTLEQALAVAANQMTGADVAALTAVQIKSSNDGWSTSVDTIDYAVGQKTTDASVTPALDQIALEHVPEGYWEPIPTDNSSIEWDVVTNEGSTELTNNTGQTQNVEMTVRLFD
jgi:hypothetical protein